MKRLGTLQFTSSLIQLFIDHTHLAIEQSSSSVADRESFGTCQTWPTQ